VYFFTLLLPFLLQPILTEASLEIPLDLGQEALAEILSLVHRDGGGAFSALNPDV
jgi:hypothetical protein